MSRKQPKEPMSPEALALVAKRFRALAEPTRLAILQELQGGELSVGEVCEAAGVSQANASKHLATLAAEGILTRRKEGLYVYYSIADETVYDLCEVVCSSLAERFERAREHFG